MKNLRSIRRQTNKKGGSQMLKKTERSSATNVPFSLIDLLSLKL